VGWSILFQIGAILGCGATFPGQQQVRHVAPDFSSVMALFAILQYKYS
jgi:hypothetical protein